MKLPPFLLSAAVLFWGWQTGLWIPALVALVLLEAPRVWSRRWTFASADLNRFSDFCALLAGGVGVLFYFNYGNPRAVILLFEWLPFVLMPLALALLWSTHGEVPLTVLFWGLRRQPTDRPRSINVGYPYFAVWLLAASAANRGGSGFYLAVALLMAWPLALHRPRSFSLGSWVGMLGLAVALGYAGQVGLNRLQLWLEGAAPEWISGSGSRTDPYRSTTDFGTVGELKQSDSIVMRVVADPEIKTPLLLHRASYDFYSGGTWIARNGSFTLLEGGASTWQLGPQAPVHKVQIHDFSPGGNPILALPAGTVRVSGLNAASLKRNTLGAVQAEAPPGYVDFEAALAAAADDEAPPAENDLRLPVAEEAVLRHVAVQFGGARAAPADVMRRIREYFGTGYAYATYLKEAVADRTRLADFLLTTHAGHCEYFATATVLLARAAGVPARYATGFSVTEYSKLEHAYLVRERHAHAWARLYVNGRWQDLDTTPATWVEVEGAHASRWAPLYDLLSWARYALSRWLKGLSATALYGSAALVALAGLAWLARGALRRRAHDLQVGEGAGQASVARAGADSEFYLIERRLAELGWVRESAQPMLGWLQTLAGNPHLDPDMLRQLALLHYRLRFDPAGLDAAERGVLRQRAAEWLECHPVHSLTR